jgi:pyruvate dehydrogenase E2 component (dihydrolipoamide acetyltransferase)
MVEIAMPRLSDSMEEGVVIAWLVGDGEPVERGQVLAEIETDKATMTFEAEASGTLERLIAVGDAVPVGAPIAHILAPGESASEAAVAPEPPAMPAENGKPPKASPVARRIAAERGINLATLTGTGPGGRIVKADVEASASAPSPAPVTTAPASVSAPSPAGDAPETVELSGAQRTIARRMVEAKSDVPHFYLDTEIDMTRATTARAALKELGTEPVPSLNDFVVKAAALALRDHPRANGSFLDGRFVLHRRVNVGIAVAAEGTLVVPTLFDADRKGLATIAAESRALAEKVRQGTIAPAEMDGGTFTVSNLGMFGVTSFDAVINPPQSGILAVGAVRRLPRYDAAGQVVPQQVMAVTLSCDHRILYGADGARFLARVRSLLEEPTALAL